MKPIRTAGKEIAQNENAALFSLIAPLDQTERNDLRAFLNSEYFNTDQRLVRLFERLRQGYENHETTGISGKPLLKYVFDTQKSGEQEEKKLPKLMRELEELIIKFFVHQEVSDSGRVLHHRAKVAALKRRRDTGRLREASENFRKRLKKIPDSLGKYANSWWLEHQNYFHRTTMNHGRDQYFFQRAFRDFNQFHYALILRYYLEHLNRKNLFDDELQMEQIKTIYDNLPRRDTDSPLSTLYTRLINALQNRGDVKAYLQMKEAYEQTKTQLADLDILISIKIAQNVCNYLFQMGWDSSSMELKYWVNEVLEGDAFLFGDIISEGEFLNVALSAAAAGAFEEQIQFMDQYREKLEPKQREKVCQLSLAYFHFHKNEYEQTLDILDTHFPAHAQEEYFYTLRVKTLRVRIYLVRYLLDGSCVDNLLLEIDALRQFVNRKEFLDETWRESYVNFKHICNKLYNYRKHSINWDPDQRRVERDKLLRELGDYKQLPSRKWLRDLIRQVDQMMTG